MSIVHRVSLAIVIGVALAVGGCQTTPPNPPPPPTVTPDGKISGLQELLTPTCTKLSFNVELQQSPVPGVAGSTGKDVTGTINVANHEDSLPSLDGIDFSRQVTITVVVTVAVAKCPVNHGEKWVFTGVLTASPAAGYSAPWSKFTKS